MRVLLMAAADPENLSSGASIAVAHLLRTWAQSTDAAAQLLTLHALTPQSRALGEGTIPRVLHVERKELRRVDILRTLSGGSLLTSERAFLRGVRTHSVGADIAVWFGFSWDPLTALLPRICACPVVHHATDSITLFEQQRLRASARRVRVALAALQERRVLRAGFRSTVYVSEADRQCAARIAPDCAAQLHAIPLGVDAGVFHPPASYRPPENRAAVLLFVGAMDYRPNIDAASYLVRSVLPRIRSSVEVVLAGRNPTAEVYALTKLDTRVRVTGTVDDMAAEYRKADLFLAPLRSGAGFKNKVLEALASGLPVITTPLGVEGFPERPVGTFVGKSAAEMAAAVDHLLVNPSEREHVGRGARAFIEAGWSWERRTRDLLVHLNP